MDKAFWDTMRWDHFRWDVTNPVFDEFLEQLKRNVSAKHMGGITPCLQGIARQGQTRHNVVVPIFDEIKESLEKR